jgi:hypothetical protein
MSSTARFSVTSFPLFYKFHGRFSFRVVKEHLRTAAEATVTMAADTVVARSEAPKQSRANEHKKHKEYMKLFLYRI